MCSAMAHRGPDGEGQYIDGNIGLGHRRLAIIDLSPQAHQPMINEDGTLVITYDGEIYNYSNIRGELETKGHVFHSRASSEVVLHAYEEWGWDCLRRLNGMFAFAIWDSRERKLFLARDRYGVKPLYYYLDGSAFVFASEIKAIRAGKGIGRKVNPRGLLEYFTFQNIYSDETLFSGIQILPAAHWATIFSGQHSISFHRFWDFDFSQVDENLNFEEASRELRFRLEQSVIRQLMSDVPLGSYLSGGMDSGSIVSIASQVMPRLMTFTGGFDLSSVTGLELNFDEREVAESMSSLFKTEHYEMILHSGDMAWVLPKLVWHLEDLRVGMSYQNWYIARLASKFVKVVLGGGGGDELFAGYPWRYLPLLRCQNVNDFEQTCYKSWQRLVSDKDRGEFFTPDFLKSTANYSPQEIFRSIFASFPRPSGSFDSKSALNRAMYFEARTFLHGLLIVEDRISSAHSLETRVPFLDNELVDFSLRLPVQFKLNIEQLKKANSPLEGRFRSSDGKYILRHAMQGLVPGKILAKKKQGFSPPDSSWYRGETMDYIKRILLDPKSLGRGYFNPAHIQNVVEQHVSGTVNHRLLIWSLLCFEWWNRLFIDEEKGLI